MSLPFGLGSRNACRQGRLVFALNLFHRVLHVSRPASVVGVATGYGLDGPGVESRWGRNFPHLSRLALGHTQLPLQWVGGLSWG
jgi:hypothetical protein